jgi:anti-sigma factor RsiW
VVVVNDVTERDLEQLDEYLDDALAPDEVEHLRIRLAEDSSLVAALEELRSQRLARAAVWTSLEPTDAQAQQLARKVSSGVRRQKLWLRVGSASRFGSAVAACLLFGFFMGWLGRERGGMTANIPPTFGQTEVNVVSSALPTVTTESPRALGVQINEIRHEDLQPMLVVRQVTPDSAAAQTNLRAGDLLLTLDGQLVRDRTSLMTALSNRKGARVLRILRDGQVYNVTIHLQ